MKPRSAELIEETRRTWQRYYRAPLTEDDSPAIATNMVHFFALLVEWADHESATVTRPWPDGGENGYRQP